MATYHVDYINGSNTTGDGSALLPWATINFAISSGATTPTDIIKVAGSGTTVIDSNASLQSAASAVFNTSVDLTSQIAVGDFVVISPKVSGNPEFDGWMQIRVTGVTATTLTVRSTLRFPITVSNSWTIEKINSIIPITVSTGIIDFTGVNAITIEGGYNNDFTQIIGLTRFVRTGLAAGSTGATLFTSTGNKNVKVKNISVTQFLSFFQAGSSNNDLVFDNIHLIDCSGLHGEQFSTLCGLNENSKFYFVNTGSRYGGTVTGRSLTPYFRFSFYIIDYGRMPQHTYQPITDYIVYRNTLGPIPIFSLFSTGTVQISMKGKMKIIDPNVSGNNCPVLVPFSSASSLSNNMTKLELTNLTIITNKTKPTFQFTTQDSSSRTAVYMKLLNQSIKDFISRVYEVGYYQTQPLFVIEDIENVYNYYSGVLVAEDKVTFLTDGSSKYFRSGLGVLVSGDKKIPIIYAPLIKNNKKLLNVKLMLRTVNSCSIRIMPARNFVDDADLFSNNTQTINTGGNWVEYTFTSTLTSPLFNYEFSSADAITPIMIELRTDDIELWIDSITVNYEV